MFDVTFLQQIVNKIRQVPGLGIVLTSIKYLFLSVLATVPVPRHVGLIMDGNRRYAKDNNMSTKNGHMAGAETLGKVCNTVRSIIRG